MPFREKLAWGACLSTIALWGGYLGYVWPVLAAGGHVGFSYALLFFALVCMQAVIMALVSIASAIGAPGDARTPADERDKMIARRAAGVAYATLILGIAATIAAMHGPLRGVAVMFALFGAIALAEAVRYAMQIIGYRRG